MMKLLDKIKSFFSKIYFLLGKNDRYWLLAVVLVSIIHALIEVAGVASIMPFLSVLSHPEVIHTNSYLSWSYEFFGFTSTRQYLVFAGFFVLGLLLFSNGFAAFSMWMKYRFNARLMHQLSKKLLEKYLSRPYQFFLLTNTSNMSQNILSEANVVAELIDNIVRLTARVILVGAIVVMLFIINPQIAFLIFAVLSAAYLTVWKIVRHHLSTIGEDRFVSNRERYRITEESFGAIKELKLMGREKYYIEAFEKPSWRYVKSWSNSMLYGQVPKFALESIAFGGILALIIYFISVGQTMEQILPIIGLYTFAGYRMMPSLQAVYRNISGLKVNTPALNSVYENIAYDRSEASSKPMDSLRNPKEREPLKIEKKIRLEDISFSYPNAENPALEKVSLEIPLATSVGLVGSTGSGKTTTINILLGLLSPQKGHIKVDDEIIDSENLSRWQANLGYVPQDIYLSDNTISQNIAFAIPPEKIDHQAVKKAAEIANIAHFIESDLPQSYETVIGERGIRLSGGQRQRVAIARALYHNPEVLVFDEATSSLDNKTERAIVKAIERIGKEKTIIQIAHRLTTVKNCHIIYVLEKGRIVGKGTYQELLETNESFRRIAN